MSLAAIKRNLQVGAKVVMVRHDWYPAGKLMGVERAVIHVQSNGVQFAGGSWLYFKAAKEYRQTANGFQVCLDGSGTFDKIMEYQFVENTTTNPTRAEIDSAGEFLLTRNGWDATRVIAMSELERVWTAEAAGWKRPAKGEMCGTCDETIWKDGTCGCGGEL